MSQAGKIEWSRARMGAGDLQKFFSQDLRNHPYIHTSIILKPAWRTEPSTGFTLTPAHAHPIHIFKLVLSDSVPGPPIPPKEKDPAAEQVLGDQAQVRRFTKIPLHGWSGPVRSSRVLKKCSVPWQHAVYLGPRLERGKEQVGACSPLSAQE